MKALVSQVVITDPQNPQTHDSTQTPKTLLQIFFLKQRQKVALKD
jgi:hypothetical protein